MYAYVYTHTCVCIYIYIHTCMYIYIYIYTHPFIRLTKLGQRPPRRGRATPSYMRPAAIDYIIMYVYLYIYIYVYT